MADPKGAGPALDLLMQDLGYSCTSSIAMMRATMEHTRISHSGPSMLTEAVVAKVLVMMCRSHAALANRDIPRDLAMIVYKGLDPDSFKSSQTWNVEVFYTVALEKNPNLDFYDVVRQLDQKDFLIQDANGLGILFTAAKVALKVVLNPVPSDIDTNAAEAAADLFGLPHLRKVIGDVSSLPAALKTPLAALLNQPWNSLELIDSLLRLSESEVHDEVKAFLELASQQSPELLLLGLSQLPVPWNPLHKELASNLVVMFLAGHPSSNFVIPLLWQIAQPLTIAGLVHIYTKDPSSLSRILDVAQEMKALTQILEAKPYAFSIDLAALASRRDYLNLEKWLQDCIRLDGNIFIKACLDFLADRVTSQLSRQEGGAMQPFVPLSVDVVSIFIRILHSHNMNMSSENAEYLKDVVASCLQAYPRLGSTYAPDVEEEANSYYEKIYKGEMTIQQVVDLLRRYRDSAVQREQDIFNFFTQVLFDEYKFFPRYPEKELNITSVLFGALIQNVFVQATTLGNSLHFVLEALRQPVGSKFFKFGSLALLQFQGRLGEWPRYCALLLQIPHLHQALPDIVQFMQKLDTQTASSESLAENRDENAAAKENAEKDRPAKPETPVFTALKLDTVLQTADKESFEIPNEMVQDKILFIINNVSFANIGNKVAEMQEMLGDNLLRWFSHYLVVKRVSIEPNFHDLYIAFLDGLQSKSLYRHILHETYLNIEILLNSEKTVTSSSERSLLKNLGTWLGGITLAKNKPIKHKNLAFKDLLLEGYDCDRLIVVIPFVCKVLEQCHASKVFKPPNPWLMAIMKMLAELYYFAELKLNLKFEIEVLCKKIQLDIKDIEPTAIVRNRPAKQMTFPKANTPGAEVATHLAGQNAQGQLGSQNQLNQEEGGVGYPNILGYITFNPNLPIFNAQPSIKRIVHFAIDRAIREIISPVVERSVTIAAIATRELILKDFALEPNEEKMRKAAHLMVQNLSGSLAAQSVPEQVVYIIVADNLDLACSVMEKAAAEKAIAEIDENLAAAYISRRKHREVFKLRITLQLAERVASRVVRPEAPFNPAPVAPVAAPAFDESSIVASTVQMLEKAVTMLLDLDKLCALNGTLLIGTLPAQHEIRTMLRQISMFINQAFTREEMVILFCQKIVQQLFKTETNIGRECLVLILERLFELSKRVAKEITAWFVYADDERKYNVPVTLILLQVRLLNVQELDMQLARLIEVGQQNVYEYCADLLRAAILDEPPCASQDAFFNTIQALSSLSRKEEAPAKVTRLLTDLSKRFGLGDLKEELKDSEAPTLREKLGMLFLEWVRMYHHPSSNEKTHASFVMQLQQQGVIQGEDISSLFFRICTELSVESYIKAKATPGVSQLVCFQAVDAFARLIVLLVRYYNEPSGANANNANLAKLNLTTKILSIIVLVLVHSHEQRRNHFNQRPFFRLFSTLLNDLNVAEEHLQPLYFQILSAISNTFHTLQPSFLPGFTFSWLQLMSHRFFMPNLLMADGQKGWPFFQRLLVDLFKFMAPFLRKSEMNDTTRLLYKATLRILLVLLHDFPEFLCDYHFSFADVIPHSCIQLRNLILSAFPRNMKLLDPFTPNLKVDLLPESNLPPHVLSDYTSSLVPNNFKTEIDTYLKTRGPVAFLLDIRSRVMLPSGTSSETGSKYNIPVINSLVLYVGVQAIAQAQSKPGQGFSPVTQSAPIDIFQQLVMDLDSEATQEVIQEQITRVLIERLIVNRPHPYGLLVTFIELIRNPRYNFWDHTNFIRCAPEIERLFNSVNKSIQASMSRQ
ncbi:hypothetical protein HDV05_005662 [Chytridiales sp. JEL 0842]|nr:hypothetical protein HDV05_005662 [Chytridiales sp. JEL 0842]